MTESVHKEMLRIYDLHAFYGESHILHGIDLTVGEGEVVTLLGRNGAGRTTILKSIIGLVGRRSGSITINGVETIGMPTHKIAHLGLGYCPEERGIFSSLTVEENLLLPPVVKEGGMTLPEIYAMFPNLLERRSSMGTRLSGGEQQMLAMARILRTGAKLLLLDEITEGLAPVIVQTLGRLIARLKENGFTIILVEQNFHFAADLADRHYVIDHGSIADMITRDSLESSREKLNRYLGVYKRKGYCMKNLFSKVGLSVAVLAMTSGMAAAAAKGISDGVVKIGVLTDMSGVYSTLGGKGTQVGVEMAVKDFGGKVLGKPIQVIGADHQNKADIASAKAREWFDNEKVDMITGLLNSGCALAVQKIAGEKKRITMNTGAGSTDLTNKACTPYSIHYVYDTYATGKVTAQAVVQNGGKSWFFITADYAFGHSLEQNTAKFVKQLGGKVLGSVRHPLSTSDFSSYLLQAQASGAQIIGLANAGSDTTNAIKQAREFGIDKKGQKLVGLLVFDTDIKSLGLNVAQGMQFTSGFYWDRDNATRAFAKRFFAIHKAMPTMEQAGAYSATMNYLKAIKAAGTDDPDAVMAKLKSMDISDFFAVHGKIRADGRMVHDMYLMQVKKPSESKGEWDLLKIVKTVPAADAFMPLSESTCPLVRK